MFHGISHVDIPVRNVERALRIYRDALGFTIRARGEGYVDIDGAAALLRLVESKNIARPASVRIAAEDVEGGLEHLAKHGAKILYRTMRTDALTLEGLVEDPDGNTIAVWRNLTEDEYGFDPEIPTEMTWDPDAEALLKSLLRSVPAIFRGLARRKVSKEAERRAGKTNRVDKELVARSYVSAQSPPNRHRARDPLRAHGYDPEDYAEEFES